MASSAVYILDTKGQVLICRNYRGDIDSSIIEHFYLMIKDKEEEHTINPIIKYDDVHFFYIQHNDLYFVSVSKGNCNAVMVFSFLHTLIKILKSYFTELLEESIRDNFVIVYELLDEVMDFGYPQSTDGGVLQEFIIQDCHKHKEQPKIPTTLTTATSWRPDNLDYKKNEVFLDVIESVNVLISVTGAIVYNEIAGSVQMRTQLTGMPELRLGLNDKVLFELTGRGRNKSVDMEDVKFHQCVRLSRFDSDRTISFIPPDGEFELMSYRMTSTSKPLFWVDSVIEHHEHSRIEYLIKIKSQFKKRSIANNVEIEIPVPVDVDTPKLKASIGSAEWLPEKSCVMWKIKSFPGLKENLLRAHFKLPSVTSEEREGKPPIHMRFEIPYYTVSGLQVRYLKIIEKRGYQALPWVRYITQNGDFQIRIQ